MTKRMDDDKGGEGERVVTQEAITFSPRPSAGDMVGEYRRVRRFKAF